MNKTMAGKIAVAKLAEKNLLELSSGKGEAFAEALGEAIYEIIKDVYSSHTHICAAAGSASATPLPILE